MNSNIKYKHKLKVKEKKIVFRRCQCLYNEKEIVSNLPLCINQKHSNLT